LPPQWLPQAPSWRQRIAQAKEQFFPLLSYRTGPYAPNGTPWANGKQDYLKLVNAATAASTA
jgi:branched-chain amino acid transport system substrate-binding protein